MGAKVSLVEVGGWRGGPISCVQRYKPNRTTLIGKRVEWGESGGWKRRWAPRPEAGPHQGETHPRLGPGAAFGIDPDILGHDFTPLVESHVGGKQFGPRHD
jgi:hypothetical protein